MATRAGVAFSSSAARVARSRVRIQPGGCRDTAAGHACERRGADGEQQLVPSEVRREKGSRAVQLVHHELAVEAVPVEVWAGSATAAFRS